MKRDELIKVLQSIPNDLNIELLILGDNAVSFAEIYKVVEYGRDPTMKTIRIIGQKTK